MKYLVAHNMISLPGGAVYKSETPIISDEQLEGVDVERLIRLGAILELREEAGHQEYSLTAAKELDELMFLTRKELNAKAATLGLNTIELPNKLAVINAIRQAEAAKKLGEEELSEAESG